MILEQKPCVSIVIPVYNAEKYLRQCIESVLSQTLNNIEIILVDDGSTDTSARIIDYYAKKDKRIVAVYKQNGGAGSAYNAGIQKAKGETIGFVENDDWVEPDMYEKLYELYKKYDTDIIKCDFYMYDAKAVPSSVPYPHGNTALKNIYKNETVFNIDEAPLLLAYHSSIWASLYKSVFIKKIPLQQTPGAGYVDFPFMFEVLLKSKKILLTYDRLYHYRLENDQQSSTKSPGIGSLRMLDQIIFVREQLRKQKKLNKYSEYFYYHASKCCAGFYSILHNNVRFAFYRRMLEVYKDFPKNFKYLYFDDNLRVFVKGLVKEANSSKCLYYINRIRMFLCRCLVCLVPFPKYRRIIRKIILR